MSLFSTVRGYAQLGGSTPGNLYRHHVPLLDGTEIDLESRRGHPTLIVNTASKCGFANQYHGLQAVYERYRDRGLLVVGTPSADFGGHEFENPDEIRLFCEGLYEIEFPLTAPMAVRFEPDPFWRDLAALPNSGPPVWNFTKYLIDGDGAVRGWWSTNVRPESSRITHAVEAVLDGQ
jgi:glutathione peroxidase